MKSLSKNLFTIGYLYGLPIMGIVLLANVFGLFKLDWDMLTAMALFLILLLSPILKSFDLNGLLKGKFKK
jgi:hypothetical protein